MADQKKADKDHHSDQLNPTSAPYKACMDDHSNQGNPTSDAHNAAVDNRAKQLNPNNPEYKGDKGDDKATPKE